ncbi:hypothetical protein DPMN_152500 [Dreissena polymorpha]|uniref:Uncharacterized protein n=1 Tax=Dreissena polymorpha TaxID=45954 RepID=A0A9D4FIE5_DREPO|nr:hypothetical protein DPMN_152500 [Dreissena polymorpha]
MCAVSEKIDCVLVCVCFPDKKQIHVHELKKGKESKLLYVVQTSFRPESLANIKKDVIVLSINTPCKDCTVASFEHFTLPGQPSTELIDGDNIADATLIRTGVNMTILVARNTRVSCYKIQRTNTKIKIKHEMWYYKWHTNKIFKDVRDITTDNEGNTYVCATGTNNIHQVSYIYFADNRILLKEIKKPTSILIDSKNSRIIICCDEDNNVHEYRFI